MTTDVRDLEGAQAVIHAIRPRAELALQRRDRAAVHSNGRQPVPVALLSTKLYMPPAHHDLIRRPRLTARLSAGVRGPLTLVMAPAGFGKTTMLADWRAAQQDDMAHGAWPVAWLALDAGDNDLARFLRYAVAALDGVHVRISTAVLDGLRSSQLPVEALLTLLLNDLAALPDDVILILDDYHAIEDPGVHRALTFMLDHLPPRLHLILATRTEPPLPLARLRARGQLTELRATDLRFTAGEASAFLHQTMGMHLSEDDVTMLNACTEGWAAGLQLAALALQGRDLADLRAALAGRIGGHRYILDYLADEVFARQPAAVQDFLIHTAVLDRLSGPLCEALTADMADRTGATGQRMLELLEAANLFLVPLDDSHTWYRYHHLFAGFLRARLRRDAPALIPTLHSRAAQWYEQQGLVVEAADHALAAQDHGLAARLVEQAIPAVLWQQGEMATLLRWLERLPRDAVRSRPRLCLDLAWIALWSAQVEAVESRLQDAEQALNPEAAATAAPSTHPAEYALRGEIAAIRAELARQRGEATAAIDLARQALADLPPDDRRVRGVTEGLLGGAYLSHGDATAASQAYGEAVALSEAPGTIALGLFASGRLVLTQALEGRLHEAAMTYRQTVKLAAARGMASTPALGVAHVGMGEVRREWNDLAGAEALLRRGIAHCTAAGGMAEMALEGYLSLARVVQARGDGEGALAILETADVLGRASSVAGSVERVAIARARLWLSTTQPDVAAAQRWADARVDAWRRDEESGYVSLLAHLTLARLHLVQGRHDEASSLLRWLLRRAEAGGLMGCIIEILVLQARLSLEQDQPAQAMIALARALALAEPAGYVRLFVDEGAPMVTLLRRAQERGVAPSYIARLLAACGAAETFAGTPAARLIDPLSVREREVVRLLAAGLSTTEIAAHLFVTSGTVRNHLKNIYSKLDVHSRLQAVESARTLHLL